MQVAINSSRLLLAANNVKTEAAFGLSLLGYYRNIGDFMKEGLLPAPRMSARF